MNSFTYMALENFLGHHHQWPESSGLGNVVDFWLAVFYLVPEHFQSESQLHLIWPQMIQKTSDYFDF